MKKQTHHFAYKSSCSQSYGFSRSCVWMWELHRKEGWAPKNLLSDCGAREDLIVPGAARLYQSILKEINPEYSLEWLMLKLKLQSFGHLMWRANSLEKKLMLGKIEGRRRRGLQRMRWLYGLINPMDMNLSKLQEIVKDREAWRAAVHGGHKKLDMTATEQQQIYKILRVRVKKWFTGDFSGDSVVKSTAFHCRGHRVDC